MADPFKPLTALRAVRDSTVSATVRVVLMAYVLRADDRGITFAGPERIAEDSGTSPKTVKRVRSQLRDLGVLEVVKRRGRGANTDHLRIHHSLLPVRMSNPLEDLPLFEESHDPPDLVLLDGGTGTQSPSASEGKGTDSPHDGDTESPSRGQGVPLSAHDLPTGSAQTPVAPKGAAWDRWPVFFGELADRIGVQNAEVWFRTVEAFRTDDGHLILTVPNHHYVGWIEDNYEPVISDMLANARDNGESLTGTWEIEAEAEEVSAPTPAATRLQDPPPPQDGDDPIAAWEAAWWVLWSERAPLVDGKRTGRSRGAPAQHRCTDLERRAVGKAVRAIGIHAVLKLARWAFRGDDYHARFLRGEAKADQVENAHLYPTTLYRVRKLADKLAKAEAWHTHRGNQHA